MVEDARKSEGAVWMKEAWGQLPQESSICEVQPGQEGCGIPVGAHIVCLYRNELTGASARPFGVVFRLRIGSPILLYVGPDDVFELPSNAPGVEEAQAAAVSDPRNYKIVPLDPPVHRRKDFQVILGTLEFRIAKPAQTETAA